MTNFLKINNISKNYGNDKVLEDISFEIKSNDFLVQDFNMLDICLC